MSILLSRKKLTDFFYFLSHSLEASHPRKCSKYRRTLENIEEHYKEIIDAYDEAEVFFHQDDYVKVLAIIEETISIHGMNLSCYHHHLLQGDSVL